MPQENRSPGIYIIDIPQPIFKMCIRDRPQTLKSLGLTDYRDGVDFLENSYLAYELDPVEDPEADWRLDVYTGSNRLPVLINEYMSAESDTMDDYHRDGIVAGFLCYPVDGFEGENRAEQILQFRDALQESIRECAGEDAVTFLGGATGLYYEMCIRDSPLDGYDHLSEAVPVPGTGCIYMIHSVSGKGRMEECLLELDMDTGRCRIAALPGMGEDLKLHWFTENWLLVQGNGEILSDDFAQLINMSTREVLRIRPGMFGGEKMQHIGMLTDGTVVIVTRRNGVGPVFRYPTDFWGFLRTANKPKKLESWREYQETYPNLPFFLPGEELESPQKCADNRLDTVSYTHLVNREFFREKYYYTKTAEEES